MRLTEEYYRKLQTSSKKKISHSHRNKQEERSVRLTFMSWLRKMFPMPIKAWGRERHNINILKHYCNIIKNFLP